MRIYLARSLANLNPVAGVPLTKAHYAIRYKAVSVEEKGIA